MRLPRERTSLRAFGKDHQNDTPPDPAFDVVVVPLELEPPPAGFFTTTTVHLPHWSVMLPDTCPFLSSEYQ